MLDEVGRALQDAYVELGNVRADLIEATVELEEAEVDAVHDLQKRGLGSNSEERKANSAYAMTHDPAVMAKRARKTRLEQSEKRLIGTILGIEGFLRAVGLSQNTAMMYPDL